ncbi:toll-like receptor 6 isoform 1-T2 [Discoglossus pictus]
MATVEFFIFILICIFTHTQCTKHQVFEKSNVANYSHQSLAHVPGNLSLDTIILDLSYNNINELQISDFNYMPHLKSLNLSHNKIGDLNCNIFEFNTFLEYIDLSNNLIRTITGIFPKFVRHLDISFNNFKNTSMCQDFVTLLHLEYLGLGASQILMSDFKAISHLHLQTVFIELRRPLDYENGSLLMLNTKELHLYLPAPMIGPYNVLVDDKNVLSNLNKYISDIVKNSKITILILSHVNIVFHDLTNAIQLIWHSSIEHLYFNDLTFGGNISKVDFDYSNTSMKSFSVERAKTTDFAFNQGDLYRFFAEMNIEHLAINSANMLFMLCPLKSSNFQSLTFIDNALTDDLFQDCATLKNLKRLELGQNKLESLLKISSMTRHMTALEYLGVRKNSLFYDEGDCNWSQSIKALNLEFNEFTETVFQCLPINIKHLFLKTNKVSQIPMGLSHMDHLEELNLASNQLLDLPNCTYFSNLTFLNVESNRILYPSPKSIQSCQSSKQIRAGHNPFMCGCEIRSFINIERRSPGKLIGWPDTYLCEKPEAIKGIKLSNFYIPEIQCNVLLLIPIIVVPTVTIFAVIFGLCKYFDVPWFLKMIWQWTRTKHRIRSTNKNYQLLQNELFFHAFVSYSEHDSSWVKNILLPNVEKDDGSVRICQHERNFIPGKSIIENIVNCIDKSYKSIFILSPRFVQSEWCHYELYFAHHKLYNENSDNLILILLEPIPQYLIPSRYYKLKALMAQRTYLEWPSEKNKQGLFWANLRASININLPEHELQSSCSEPSISA